MILICLSYLTVFSNSALAGSSLVTLSSVATAAARVLMTGQAVSYGDAASLFVFPAVYQVSLWLWRNESKNSFHDGRCLLAGIQLSDAGEGKELSRVTNSAFSRKYLQPCWQGIVPEKLPPPLSSLSFPSTLPSSFSLFPSFLFFSFFFLLFPFKDYNSLFDFSDMGFLEFWILISDDHCMTWLCKYIRKTTQSSSGILNFLIQTTPPFIPWVLISSFSL